MAVTTRTNDPYGYLALIRLVQEFCLSNKIDCSRVVLLEYTTMDAMWERQVRFSVDGGGPITVGLPDHGQIPTKKDLAPLFTAIRLAC